MWWLHGIFDKEGLQIANNSHKTGTERYVMQWHMGISHPNETASEISAVSALPIVHA